MGTESIIVLILVSLLVIYVITQTIMAWRKRASFSLIPFILMIIGVLFAILVIYQGDELKVADWAQILLMIGLVTVTATYAWSTQRMAKANEKMAEQMRAQRIMASRPIIVLKAVVETETKLRTFGSKDWFSYFEVYNEGNGPAIELEIYLLNENKSLIESARETILRANEPPIRFLPSNLNNLKESVTHYLLCQYQSILSREIWYQTWFPFEPVKSSKNGKIYVKPRELEFIKTNKKGYF